MTLDQLRIFLAVAEREHVTQAAAALGLTQSAVSAAIAALEARHDTRLFDRVGRHIELTAAGKTFLGEARAVVARAEAAELMLSELGSHAKGAINVAASQTIASYWLPPHLVRFRESAPEVDVRLEQGNTSAVIEAVKAGTADIGFVEGEVKAAALAIDQVGIDEMVLVVAPDHPLAGRRSLKPADLAAADWIVREPGSGTRSEAENAVAALGVPIHERRIAMVLPSNEAVRAAVEAGAGIAALSELVVAESIRGGRLERLKPALGRRAFHVVRHKERRLSKAAEALIDHCKSA